MFLILHGLWRKGRREVCSCIDDDLGGLERYEWGGPG